MGARSENIRNFLKESMAGVDRDGDSSVGSSGEKKSNKSNPSKRPASRPKAYLSGSDKGVIKDKEPQAQEPGKKYLISRLFSTYQSIKNENDTKSSIKSSNSHSSRKEIRFNIDDYIIRNTALPNYFNMSADEIGNSINDFYVKTKCFYLANSEIEGMLILKKDKMVFRSSTAYDYSNIEKLK
jgi:hypothetical protein